MAIKVRFAKVKKPQPIRTLSLEALKEIGRRAREQVELSRPVSASKANDVDESPGPAEPIPPTLEGFATWLGVELTPGQLDVVRRVYDAPGRASVVCIVAGRRAGKSYVLVALRLLHGLLTRDVSRCAPGNPPTALVIAPNQQLRSEVLQFALGAVRHNAALSGMLTTATASKFGLKRPDGTLVEFSARVATRGGYGGRGSNWTDAALDECAFFRDKSAAINDDDIFRAVSPGVLPGGQVIVASTPWLQKGLLYDLWSRNKDQTRDAVVVHAPTLELNPDKRELVEREYARDPENARREFGAEFLSGSTLTFFPNDLIDSCVDDAMQCDVRCNDDVE